MSFFYSQHSTFLLICSHFGFISKEDHNKRTYGTSSFCVSHVLFLIVLILSHNFQNAFLSCRSLYIKQNIELTPFFSFFIVFSTHALTFLLNGHTFFYTHLTCFSAFCHLHAFPKIKINKFLKMHRCFI